MIEITLFYRGGLGGLGIFNLVEKWKCREEERVGGVVALRYKPRFAWTAQTTRVFPVDFAHFRLGQTWAIT
jgi:hypothetical protein